MTLRDIVSRIPFISGAKRLELHPPFWLMRISVTKLSKDWRSIQIKLPQTAISMNNYGGVFGGFQASLADPIAVVACSHIFPGYAIWTRELSLDFQQQPNTDLTLHFELSPQLEQQIRDDLANKGRSTPTFEMYYQRSDGEICTVIKNTIAIRPQGYKKQQPKKPPQTS